MRGETMGGGSGVTFQICDAVGRNVVGGRYKNCFIDIGPINTHNFYG
jgi:hypothetical protein